MNFIIYGAVIEATPQWVTLVKAFFSSESIITARKPELLPNIETNNVI